MSKLLPPHIITSNLDYFSQEEKLTYFNEVWEFLKNADYHEEIRVKNTIYSKYFEPVDRSTWVSVRIQNPTTFSENRKEDLPKRRFWHGYSLTKKGNQVTHQYEKTLQAYFPNSSPIEEFIINAIVMKSDKGQKSVETTFLLLNKQLLKNKIAKL